MKKLVQVGVRDCCEEETSLIEAQKQRVATFFDKTVKQRQFEGETWKNICMEIIEQLPGQVHVSFDVDGLDPKLCPHTGTPVPGGLELEQVFYLLDMMEQGGKKLLSFDLVEVAYAHDDWDVNVGARILFRLCELLVASHPGNA
jgi:agmatinase